MGRRTNRNKKWKNASEAVKNENYPKEESENDAYEAKQQYRQHSHKDVEKNVNFYTSKRSNYTKKRRRRQRPTCRGGETSSSHVDCHGIDELFAQLNPVTLAYVEALRGCLEKAWGRKVPTCEVLAFMESDVQETFSKNGVAREEDEPEDLVMDFGALSLLLETRRFDPQDDDGEDNVHDLSDLVEIETEGHRVWNGDFVAAAVVD